MVHERKNHESRNTDNKISFIRITKNRQVQDILFNNLSVTLEGLLEESEIVECYVKAPYCKSHIKVTLDRRI